MSDALVCKVKWKHILQKHIFFSFSCPVFCFRFNCYIGMGQAYYNYYQSQLDVPNTRTTVHKKTQLDVPKLQSFPQTPKTSSNTNILSLHIFCNQRHTAVPSAIAFTQNFSTTRLLFRIPDYVYLTKLRQFTLHFEFNVY